VAVGVVGRFEGVDPHANVWVGVHDQAGLEQLRRYLFWPPVAQVEAVAAPERQPGGPRTWPMGGSPPPTTLVGPPQAGRMALG
jgi:hypothetical protein